MMIHEDSSKRKQNFFHKVIITVSSVWGFTFFIWKYFIQHKNVYFIYTIYICMCVSKYGDTTKNIYTHTYINIHCMRVHIYFLQVLQTSVPF